MTEYKVKDVFIDKEDLIKEIDSLGDVFLKEDKGSYYLLSGSNGKKLIVSKPALEELYE